MVGNYALYRKDNNKPILVGDVAELDEFVKELCKLNPMHCKKRDYEIKAIDTKSAPKSMPAIVGDNLIAMATKKGGV